MVRDLSFVLLFCLMSSPLFASQSTDCEKQAGYALGVVQLKLEGATDEQIIDWLLEAVDTAVSMGTFSQADADRALATMMVATELRGTPNQVATFTYDRCMK